MTFTNLWRPARIAFEGEGAGGGGEDTQPGGGGNDTQPGGGGNDTQPGGGGNDTQPGGGAGGKWWEKQGRFTTDEQAWLASRGLQDDNTDAVLDKLVKGHRNAEMRLGRGVDQILDRPKEGQKLVDWQRENAEIFGLPKTIEDVQIERPAELPAGVEWSDDFAAQAKKAAFDLGLNKDQLRGVVDLQIAFASAQEQAAQATIDTANTTMMAALDKEWGAEKPAMIARAKQAAGVIGEAAGLDAAGIAAVTQVLTDKAGGDAATLKFFAALGDMVAEDKMVGGGGGRTGMTAADARAKLNELQSPGGAFYEASKEGNQRKIADLQPEIERLTKLASGGKA